jgi:DNA replication protein DnaC
MVAGTLGPPGVGKSHLAIALTLKAAEASRRILFPTLEPVITKLKRAKQEDRLERQLQQLTVRRQNLSEL